MQNLVFHYSSDAKLKNKHQDEDFFVAKNNLFAIFDGVASWSDNDNYPNPSSGEKAAKLAVNLFQDYFSSSDNFIFEDLNNFFKKLNKEIGDTNNGMDLSSCAATTGVFGFVKDNHLYFAQINESGIMSFDKQRNRELDIVSNASAVNKYFKKIRENSEIEPGSFEEHVEFRNNVVNNLEAKVDGEKINFGVINGQENALNFLRAGIYPMVDSGITLIYSNGFIPFVYDQEFIDILFTFDEEKIKRFIEEKISQGEKYQKEKTLILIRHNE